MSGGEGDRYYFPKEGIQWEWLERKRINVVKARIYNSAIERFPHKKRVINSNPAKLKDCFPKRNEIGRKDYNLVG